ncbi:MAG: PA14 domain-containing protein, partial [Bryobacteraceae bacterium]
IRHNSSHLPEVEKRKPRGAIYTTSLNVPPQDFQKGFPGVTARFEWFAIEYTGRFWIEKPGAYKFQLTSDDGSKLYIDDALVVNNDGQHPPQTVTAAAELSGGIHRLRVSYFQGRRFQVALQLMIAGPGEPFRVFSTDEFKPPPNPETWAYPDTPKKLTSAK